MHRALEEPSTATAPQSWPQRYAQLLAAHTRLQQTLAAQATAHRRKLTVIKYEPSLPNNDVFTKELLAQNRELQRHCRKLKLRLAKLDTGSVSLPISPRRSMDRSGRKAVVGGVARVVVPRPSVKHAEVQTQPEDNNSEERAHCENVQAKQTATVNVPEDVQTLVDLLKQRLTELDLDLTRLQQENELLRAELGKPTSTKGEYGDTVELRTREQQQELEHLLGDRMRQMKILEKQFTHLQSKVKTKTLLYSENLSKIEQLTSELFDAKQTLLQQAERLHAQEDTNTQKRLLEKEVHVLRKENAALNETVGVLSARPLDALNMQLEKKALQLSLLDEKNATLESELKRASQDHRVVMQTNDKLRFRVETLTQQLEIPLKEIQTLKAEREQLIGAREIAEMQLQFYLSGESIERKELMDAVGRPLKQMRTAKEGPLDERHRIQQPKEKQETEVGHTTLQSERAEKMAHVTKLIQEETRAQLQEQKVAHHAEMRALQLQCARWQQRANEYLRENKRLRNDGHVLSSPTTIQQYPTSKKAPVHSSAVSKSHMEETLLEVRLYDLRYTGGARVQDPSSLVLFCDYFDFETQHSPVFTLDPDSPSRVAPLEMEISFKLLVDHAFCRSPVAQSFTVELHHLQVASASVVGVADVALQSLFLSEQGYVTMSAKLLDPMTHAAVGTVRVALSLSRPIAQFFRDWCQGDLARIRPMPRFYHSSSDTAAKPANLQLSIRLVAIAFTKETAVFNSAPATVRYRFMGNSPVRYTTHTAPQISYGFRVFTIDRAKTFEMPSDAAMVAFLERHEMALEIHSAGGTHGQAQVVFQSVVRGFRASSYGSIIVSAIISTMDKQSQLGRVWIELQAVDAKAVETIHPMALRDPVTRVFGNADSTLMDWHRFCEVMRLTSSERVVRQLLCEKLQTKNDVEAKAQLMKVLKEAFCGASDDDLSSLFQRADLHYSRSELSLLSASLFTNGSSDPLDKDPVSIRHTHVQGCDLLVLLAETLDDDWLRVEPRLRHHVETLGVVATYPQREKTEWIPWDAFVHRIRLMT